MCPWPGDTAVLSEPSWTAESICSQSQSMATDLGRSDQSSLEGGELYLPSVNLLLKSFTRKAARKHHA